LEDILSWNQDKCKLYSCENEQRRPYARRSSFDGVVSSGQCKVEYAVVELKGSLAHFLRSIKVLFVPSVYCSCFNFLLPLDEEGKIISNISTCEDNVEAVVEVK
jgi:hypothetical protein